MTTRTATWATIGQDISGATNVAEALKTAHLDFNVTKEAIRTQNGTLIPNNVALVRDDTKDVLGIVGHNYQICQNREAFNFVDQISGDLKYEKAGMTHSGLIYIIAALPKANVLDDEFDQYLIFQNSHNGKHSVRATICPLRIVCQNQFVYAFKNSENTFNIRHSTNLTERLHNAQQTLTTTANYLAGLNEEAEDLFQIKLSTQKVKKIINTILPIDENLTNDTTIEKIKDQRSYFLGLHNQDDNQNYKNTGWGLINAYSDFITHPLNLKNTENKEENLFLRTALSRHGQLNTVADLVRAA